MKTKITELLNIKYPILGGGMSRIGNAQLAAAISEAGGMGFITSANFDTPEGLRKDIQIAKTITKKPIGVNLTLSPRRKKLPNEKFIEVLVEEGIRVVETTGKHLGDYISLLKEHDVIVIHKVAGVRYAKTAERLGADVVVIIGIEAGGHPGEHDMGNMVLIPRTVDEVNIPVIAGGGIADGRGMAAALSLGAEGILMGTKFMATKEAPIHENVKRWMVDAIETDTTLIQRSIGSTTRVIKNKIAKEVLEAEMRKASVEELLPLIQGERTLQVFHEGDLNGGIMWCGSSLGLINEVLTVKDSVAKIIKEFNHSVKKLNKV